MTRLLVSVRNLTEAQAALRGGADLIDVKEPAAGALGAATPATWREVERAAATRCPVSVALGELLDEGSRHLLSDTFGVNFAKLGLAGCASLLDWHGRWREAIDSLPVSVVPVAAAYADYAAADSPAPELVLDHALRLDCGVLLLDTWSKAAGDLFQALSIERIAALARRARNRGMMVALAGSLSFDSLPTALSLEPDIIAVRGAVCESSRTGLLREDLVRQFATKLRETNARRDSTAPYLRLPS